MDKNELDGFIKQAIKQVLDRGASTSETVRALSEYQIKQDELEIKRAEVSAKINLSRAKTREIETKIRKEKDVTPKPLQIKGGKE